MLRTTKSFLTSFFQNSGVWIAFAMLISKISFFIINIFIARWLLKDEIGLIFKVQNFIGFFIPFVGLGTYQGLLKFGASFNSKEKFENLKEYSFYQGFRNQIIINLMILLLACFLFWEEINTLHIYLFFTIRLLGLFFFEAFKASERASFNNKNFAILEILVSLTTLFLILLCVPFFGLYGYIFSICIAPFVVLFFKWNKIKITKKLVAMPTKKFWEFNLYTSSISFINEIFYLTDVFIVSFLFTNEVLADYKVASFIPLNLIFLSRIFIHTDYPKLCKESKNKSFLRKYALQYLLIFLPISLLLILFCNLFSKEILNCFGKEYQYLNSYFSLFLISSFFGLLLRVPFSNILFAISKNKEHFYISLFSIILIILFSGVFYKIYQIKGIIFANILATGLSGVLYFSVFLKYLKEK